MIAATKNQLRKKLRAERCLVDSYQRTLFAIEASKHFNASPLFQQSKKIACYFASKEEFDVDPIIELILSANKQCYVPILVEKNLQFVRYHKNDLLQPNSYKILEPVNKNEKIEPDQLDLILMPLIGFDFKGHRLGTGGGFYDRTLSPRPICKLIGVGFEIQHVETLPFDEWDVLLDGVLTEKGLALFGI